MADGWMSNLSCFELSRIVSKNEKSVDHKFGQHRDAKNCNHRDAIVYLKRLDHDPKRDESDDRMTTDVQKNRSNCLVCHQCSLERQIGGTRRSRRQTPSPSRMRMLPARSSPLSRAADGQSEVDRKSDDRHGRESASTKKCCKITSNVSLRTNRDEAEERLEKSFEFCLLNRICGWVLAWVRLRRCDTRQLQRFRRGGSCTTLCGQLCVVESLDNSRRTGCCR